MKLLIISSLLLMPLNAASTGSVPDHLLQQVTQILRAPENSRVATRPVMPLPGDQRSLLQVSDVISENVEQRFQHILRHLNRERQGNPRVEERPRLRDPLADPVSSSQIAAKRPRLMENHPVSSSQVVDGFKVNGQFPKEVELQIFEQLSMTFEEAKKIASDKLVSLDWAYKYHDPSKDKNALFKKWMEMDDSKAEDELREKMMLNPTLRKFFDWKGEINPSHDNLVIAIKSGNLDMVNYLIGKNVEPSVHDKRTAIRRGDLEIFKILLKNNEPTKIDLENAIRFDKLDIFKYLIAKGVRPYDLDDAPYHLIRQINDRPNFMHLEMAINLDNLNIIRYLVEEGHVIPNNYHLALAKQRGNQDIIQYLTRSDEPIPFSSIFD